MPMFVRVLSLLLACILASAQHPGLKLRVSEQGLNRVMKHFLEYRLVPLLKDYDFGEYTYDPLIFNKITVVTVDEPVATVDAMKNNQIRLVVKIQKVHLTANFTLTKPERENSPDASMEFINSEIDITVQLGTGDVKDGIDITACAMSIEGFNSNNAHLRGMWILGGDALTKKIEEICPSLKNQTDETLKDVLNIEETMTFRDVTGNSDIQVSFALISMVTEGDYISVVSGVTFAGETKSSDVTFPSATTLQANKEFDIWINAPVMERLSKFFTVDIEKEMKYNINVKDKPFAVSSSVSDTSSSVTITTKGMFLSTSSNYTLVHRGTNAAGQPCEFTMKTSFTSELPTTISVNDTIAQIGLDQSRFQMRFKVSGGDGYCVLPTAADTQDGYERNLLLPFFKQLDNKLKDKLAAVKLPQTSIYGFHKASLHMLQGVAVVTSNVGISPYTPTSQLTSHNNTAFGGRKITFEYTTGTEQVVEDKPTVVDGGRALQTTAIMSLLGTILVRIL